jgi:hypothetical protein
MKNPKLGEQRSAPEILAILRKWVRTPENWKCEAEGTIPGILFLLGSHVEEPDLPCFLAFAASNKPRIRQYAYECILAFYLARYPRLWKIDRNQLYALKPVLYRILEQTLKQ